MMVVTASPALHWQRAERFLKFATPWAITTSVRPVFIFMPLVTARGDPFSSNVGRPGGHGGGGGIARLENIDEDHGCACWNIRGVQPGVHGRVIAIIRSITSALAEQMGRL